ncbi:MAG TPA: hypothetical protein VFQ35_05600 [Polyangiaceae bacterium]|nr:hypothetical protein [Polyangiaceae bacterium]
MSSLRFLASPKSLVTAVVLCLAAPLAAQPRLELERAETVKQLNEAKERVKLLEARLRLLDARRVHEQAAAVQPISNNCSNPFFLDTDGVKHFRVECLVTDTRAACEANPFTVDDDGIKRIRPTCGGQ